MLGRLGTSVAVHDPKETSAAGSPGPPLSGVRWITVVAVALWLLVVGLGFGLGATDFAVASAIGGAIAIINFQMMWRAAVSKLFGPVRERAVVWSVLRWTGLLLALITAVWLVGLDPLGLLVGLTMVVVAIPLSAALGLVRG